jgi:hypothetical protein
MSKLPADGPLFPVKGQLAARYALALKHARDLACPLSEFSIDRMGWSPQLAFTLGDDYLSTEALHYAIILSPDQASAALRRRRFSYEAALIELVYFDARATLLNLIEYEPMVVELDNNLTFCRSAIDVVGIREAEARIETPRGTLAKSRKALELARGLSEPARLLDDSYIDQILALVKDVGDPRRRTLPPELRMPVGSLWAEVAGAVYVLRPPPGKPGETILIATRLDAGLKSLPVTALELGDPRTVELLQAAGFLRYANSGTQLRKRLGDLELEALLATGELAPANDGPTRRRQIGSSPAAQAALPPLYWELDAEQKRLAAGAPFEPRRLSPEARWALSTPARDVDVVGHLLTRFVRFDYRLMAHHHHRIVQAEWSRYSPAKQRYLEAAFPYMTQSFVRATDAPASPPAIDAGGGVPT